MKMFAFSSRFLYKPAPSNSIMYKVYSTLCGSFYTTYCFFLAHIASQLPQVYSHANFFYKYMNPLKIIHKEEK